ncbi:MAG: HEAT repeat domain-containing protein [Acidobacteriaceae bacterium]
MKPNLFAIFLLGASLLAVAQQQPKVVNAQFHSEPVGAGLSATVDRFQHANGPLWLGYQVPALPGSHFSVCSGDSESSMEDGCCGEYRLEDSDHSFQSSNGNPRAETNIDVLLRIDQGAVAKIRFVGAGCRLDAGGRPFTWLTDVQPDDSVAYLASLATAGSTHRLADEALAALAMHATPKATTQLAVLAASSNPLWLRDMAALWLGAERGHDGLLVLEKFAQTDTDPEFRKKLTFDISTNHDPAAVDDLIHMAKSDSDTAVREQALFWVGQKASAKAVAALKDAVENDPEVAVKKKAVFALSQLPKDEAVPELMHVAETNRDPAVRREAIFWLGQTHDPRALQYFEQILAH